MTATADRPIAPSTIADVLRHNEARPRPPSAWSASLTFTWRALLKIKHVPEQLLDVTLTPISFTLVFTYLFGGAIAGSPTDYVQYLLPGILTQTMVMMSMYAGITLHKDMSKGVFDRFRSLPIWRAAPMVGALVGDLCRYTIALVVTVAVGLLVGFRPHGGLLGVVAGALLVMVFAFSLSWVWTTIGMLMRTEQAVLGTSMLIMFPLAFTSNILVEPQTMPGWLRTAAEVNPVSHLATATRGLMQNTLELDQLAIVLGWSAGLVIVFAPLTMRLYGRRT